MTLNQALKVCREMNKRAVDEQIFGITKDCPKAHPFVVFKAGKDHYVKHLPSMIAVKDSAKVAGFVSDVANETKMKEIQEFKVEKPKKEINLADATFKKIHTVKDLMKYLRKLDPNEPITMFSDEEGNQVNKILCLELYEEGLTFIPWEQH